MKCWTTNFSIHASECPVFTENQLKSVYNIPFLDSYSHPIHTCLSMIASNGGGVTPNASWNRSDGHGGRGWWWSEVNHLDRTTTPGQHPPDNTSFPPGQHLPLDNTSPPVQDHHHPPRQHFPPLIHMGTTVNGRMIHILLGCILVSKDYSNLQPLV